MVIFVENFTFRSRSPRYCGDFRLTGMSVTWMWMDDPKTVRTVTSRGTEGEMCDCFLRRLIKRVTVLSYSRVQ